ncbi:TIGR03619 family F420-dependent LLM class oxidoreductase [Phytohabitans kaempferiae]|uniref:TIGR03619 family F420-dependent LLM class oxidoreductase n=1 Tax=Phytohabitans kaempferiae TaxID=1620943 RepID=A0ABV6M7B3_9ACTN
MTKLGLFVPNFGPTATPDLLRGWVRFAESHGFDLAMMSDHVAPTRDVTDLYPSPFYDPFATLAWLGGLTERLELGTTVAVVPYRHPLLTARMANNIDQFTGGRFILGTGVGWSEAEFAAVGVPFRERGRMTDEYLRVITDAWANDVVSFDGEYVSFRDVATGPRSARAPHPPLWIGGWGPAAVRRVVRFGDAWHPNQLDLERVEATLPLLREEAERQGRAVPAFCPRMRAQVTEGALLETGRPFGRGSLAQIRGDLATLIELGAAYVVLDTSPDHPGDRRPPERDWETLAAVVAA